MFCIASASGNSFFAKDQENVKNFLKATTDSSGGSGIGVRSIRSMEECTEKNFTVNGNPYTLLLNEAQCPRDQYKGKMIQIFDNFSEIVISRRQCFAKNR